MHEQHFIGGEWIDSSGDSWIDVVNPANEDVIGRVPDGTPADVERAVHAAREAFAAWSATTPEERAQLLGRLRDSLRERQEEMASLITAEMGAPTKLAMGPQTRLPIDVLSCYVDLVRSPLEDERIGNSIVEREPVGVVAAITPWNYPLHQAMAKIAPALAAGCTVVHKPSELTPFSALLLAELVAAAGFPAGVFNVITGTGLVAGEAMVSDPDVDMVSFTGSTRAGRRVGALAAETVKRVALELGGKSANVILDDADLTTAVKVGVANCFLNSGQSCNAWTRMLVPAARASDAAEFAVAAAARYRVGDPTDPETRLGPLVSSAQRERVRGYIEAGQQAGARLLLGGAGGDGLPPRGYYVAPTVFADVHPDMSIAQEEIFGPVLSILAYQDEDEAVRIANGTMYGLAGAVWSSDVEHATRVARRLRAGQVDINGAPFNPMAPFGGYKQSGHGRELGPHGLDEYLQLKAIQLP